MNNEEKILSILEKHSSMFEAINAKLEQFEVRFEQIDARLESIEATQNYHTKLHQGTKKAIDSLINMTLRSDTYIQELQQKQGIKRII
jgi:hypothetical protein